MNDHLSPESKSGPPPITRREAMLQILRTGTNAAAAIGVAYWLSTHSARPIPAPPRARPPRPPHRRQLRHPTMSIVQNGEPSLVVIEVLLINREIERN